MAKTKIWVEVDYEFTLTEGGSSLIELSITEKDGKLVDFIRLANEKAKEEGPNIVSSDIMSIINTKLSHKIKKIYLSDDKGEPDLKNPIDI